MISILENTKHLNMMKTIYNEEFKELLHPKKIYYDIEKNKQKNERLELEKEKVKDQLNISSLPPQIIKMIKEN